MSEDSDISAPMPHTEEGIATERPIVPTAGEWRGFVREIVVVVLGVLLALAAQQLVEAANWRQKVRVAESAIRSELSDDLGLATELKLLHPCVNGYLDLLQRAVIADDVATLRQLAAVGAPIVGRAWPRDTWASALQGQVPERIEETRVTAYSRAFLRIGVQREFMQQMEDLYPVALSGSFGLPRDASVAHDQIVAIQRLRRLEGARQMIADSLLGVDGPAVGVRPSRRYLASDQVFARRCSSQLGHISGAR